MPKRRIVVCGAGFAGVRVAKMLESDCDVTLVAPTDRFVYLPLIHEVLSENVTPGEVTKPLPQILPRTQHHHGRAARVEGSTLITVGGDSLPFDDLVVAIGAEPNDFGVPGVHEHTLSFYSIGDALRANATLKMKATEVHDRPLRVAVVGGGFTGVEVAGEAAELLDKLGVARQITILEAMDEIFPRQTAEFRDGIYRGLDRLDLALQKTQKIVEARADELHIAGPDGAVPFPADVVFWCAGAKPRRLDGVDPRVLATLQSVARDDVWVLGDAADFPRELATPKLAQAAEDQAPIVAHNILHPNDKHQYRPHVKGLIVSIGHRYAVAEVFGQQVWTGQIPWHIKRTLYKAKIALA